MERALHLLLSFGLFHQSCYGYFKGLYFIFLLLFQPCVSALFLCWCACMLLTLWVIPAPVNAPLPSALGPPALLLLQHAARLRCGDELGRKREWVENDPSHNRNHSHISGFPNAHSPTKFLTIMIDLSAVYWKHESCVHSRFEVSC